MKSSLMSMMEKTRMVQFTLWVSKVKLSDRETWKAGTISKTKLPLDTMSGEKFFAYWGLEKSTIEFLTHACCLYRDDTFKTEPAIHLVRKMQLYLESKTRFSGMTSPYLYPPMASASSLNRLRGWRRCTVAHTCSTAATMTALSSERRASLPSSTTTLASRQASRSWA